MTYEKKNGCQRELKVSYPKQANCIIGQGYDPKRFMNEVGVLFRRELLVHCFGSAVVEEKLKIKNKKITFKLTFKCLLKHNGNGLL